MTLIFLVAGAVTLRAEPLSVADVAKRNGDALFNGIHDLLFRASYSDPKPSLAEKQMLLQHFESEVSRVGFDDAAREAFKEFLPVLSNEATRQDFERLLSLWDRTKDFEREWTTSVLLEIATRLEIDSILSGKTNIRVSVPAFSGEVPPHIAEASPEILSAWKKFQSFQSLDDVRLVGRSDTNKHWISFQGNSSNFFKAVSDLLHARETNSIETISLFEWAGWCGTGSERLYGPKNQSLLLAFLRAQQWDRALSLVFQNQADSARVIQWSDDQEDEGWQRAFINACGLDWEELYSGAFIAANGWHFRGDDKVRILAQYGSVHAVQLLVQMSDVIKDRSRSDYLRAISILIDADQSHTSISSQGYVRKVTIKIPKAMQVQLINILCHDLRTEAGAESATLASELLMKLARPESKGPLLGALKSPYNKVRANAAAALRAMGETISTPSPLPPVKFLIRTNGIPLQHSEIWYTLQATNIGRRSSLSTDASGMIKFDRDLWVDPYEKITNVVFERQPFSRCIRPNQCYFSVAFPRPSDLEAINETNIPVSSLTLKITYSRSANFYYGKSMEVFLRPDDESSYVSMVGEGFTGPCTNRICFAALEAKCKYKVEVRAPSAALWTSVVYLKPQPQEIEVVLQSGFDVTCTVFRPGATEPEQYIACELLADGSKEEMRQNMHMGSFDSAPDLEDDATGVLPKLPALKQAEEVKYQEWNNLLPGKYRLHVFSTAELNAQREKNEIVVDKALAHLGTNILFTIETNSPPVMNLGAIHLQASKN